MISYCARFLDIGVEVHAHQTAIQNPLVGIANRAMELMHKFLGEFGLTPSSRTRLQAPPAHTDPSEWVGFGSG